MALPSKTYYKKFGQFWIKSVHFTFHKVVFIVYLNPNRTTHFRTSMDLHMKNCCFKQRMRNDGVTSSRGKSWTNLLVYKMLFKITQWADLLQRKREREREKVEREKAEREGKWLWQMSFCYQAPAKRDESFYTLTTNRDISDIKTDKAPFNLLGTICLELIVCCWRFDQHRAKWITSSRNSPQ